MIQLILIGGPIMNEQTTITNKELISFIIDKICNYAETPDNIDPTNHKKYIKLNLSPEERKLVTNFLYNLPSRLKDSNLSLSFPEGIQSSIKLIGQFCAYAGMNEVLAFSGIAGLFISIAASTCQQYLSSVTDSLSLINSKLDKILEFLYGDKKAELLAEINFTRYAHQNFNQIVKHDTQRLATIVSLQSSKKIAMKDIEFYIMDLQSVVEGVVKNPADLDKIKDTADNIRKSLMLSLELFMNSTLLEVYYAQNTDPIYIHNIIEDTRNYIETSREFILTSYSKLDIRYKEMGNKPKPLLKKNFDKELSELDKIIKSIHDTKTSKELSSIENALNALSKNTQYLISNAGDVYMKAE